RADVVKAVSPHLIICRAIALRSSWRLPIGRLVGEPLQLLGRAAGARPVGDVPLRRQAGNLQDADAARHLEKSRRDRLGVVLAEPDRSAVRVEPGRAVLAGS